MRIIFCWALIFWLRPVAAGENWEFVLNEESISVDRVIDPHSPVVIFRGRATMDARISQLMAVLFDPRTQSEWNNTGYDLRVLERISDIEVFFYSALRVPWPFRDRDFVIRLETEINARQRSVIARAKEAVHPLAPPHKKRVRLPVSRVNWQFKAAGRQTEVTVTFQVDPGGVLPLWLMNKVTKSMPLVALRNIRHVIREKTYDLGFEKRFEKYNGWHARRAI